MANFLWRWTVGLFIPLAEWLIENRTLTWRDMRKRLSGSDGESL